MHQQEKKAKRKGKEKAKAEQNAREGFIGLFNSKASTTTSCSSSNNATNYTSSNTPEICSSSGGGGGGGGMDVDDARFVRQDDEHIFNATFEPSFNTNEFNDDDEIEKAESSDSVMGIYLEAFQKALQKEITDKKNGANTRRVGK